MDGRAPTAWRTTTTPSLLTIILMLLRWVLHQLSSVRLGSLGPDHHGAHEAEVILAALTAIEAGIPAAASMPSDASATTAAGSAAPRAPNGAGTGTPSPRHPPHPDPTTGGTQPDMPEDVFATDGCFARRAGKFHRMRTCQGLEGALTPIRERTRAAALQRGLLPCAFCRP
jgi:hypothetical protein